MSLRRLRPHFSGRRTYFTGRQHLRDVAFVAHLPALSSAAAVNLSTAESGPCVGPVPWFWHSGVTRNTGRSNVYSTSGPARMPTQSVVHSDPEILGGTPVFVGTRVPVKS